MDIAKQLAEKARAAGKVNEGGKFFSVTDKKSVTVNGVDMTVDVPNGRHKVVILAEKVGTGKSFDGKEQQQLMLEITDNGTKKEWNMPVKNADGTLYYLIQDLEEIEIGQEFNVEAVKMKNGKYAKRISHSVKGDEVPTIQLNDEDNQGVDEELPDLQEDIDPASIPF